MEDQRAYEEKSRLDVLEERLSQSHIVVAFSYTDAGVPLFQHKNTFSEVVAQVFTQSKILGVFSSSSSSAYSCPLLSIGLP